MPASSPTQAEPKRCYSWEVAEMFFFFPGQKITQVIVALESCSLHILRPHMVGLCDQEYHCCRILALGLYNFVRVLRWAYKQRGLYPRGLGTGINKSDV